MKHPIAALALGTVILAAGLVGRAAGAAEFDTLQGRIRKYASSTYPLARQPCVCREAGASYNVAGYTLYSPFGAGNGTRELAPYCVPVTFTTAGTPLLGPGCSRFLILAK